LPKPRREIIIDKIYEELHHETKREFIAEVIRLFATNHGIRPLLARRYNFKIKYLGKFIPLPSERRRWDYRKKRAPERKERGLKRKRKWLKKFAERNRETLERLNKYRISKGYKPFKHLPSRMTRKGYQLRLK